MAASSSRAPRRFRVFLTSRKMMLGAVFPPARLRRWLLVTLTLITILMGPGGFLTSLPLAYAATPQAALGSGGLPNRFNPTQDASSTPRTAPSLPPDGRSGPPAPILRNAPLPMQPGRLVLTPGKAATFLGSDGRFEVDVPGSATTAADQTAAHGTLVLQITQIAPASGAARGAVT